LEKYQKLNGDNDDDGDGIVVYMRSWDVAEVNMAVTALCSVKPCP